MTGATKSTLLDATRAQRASLADDLRALTDEQWATESLCTGWTVQDVVAHLTAAASLGRVRWIRSAIGARFDFDLHNARRLAEHRGLTPADTLARFEQIIDSTASTFGPKEAWLGEVVVHGGDIRRPLGLRDEPPVEIMTPLAVFYASRNFTVASKSASEDLRLEATDGPFRTDSSGPRVSGTTYALVMAMAGRTAFYDDLEGPGVQILRHRTIKTPTVDPRTGTDTFDGR